MSLHQAALAVDILDSIHLVGVYSLDPISDVLDNLVASYRHGNVLLQPLVQIFILFVRQMAVIKVGWLELLLYDLLIL